ncbi:GNAT family N-acetyltransferase [Planosporangium sp. 12N6]|uniref:GNAT family N-acetyltransferase n=1 Tax=Planosporangium spinosum TaxID=3402278 RepID=UPI003CF36925
MRELTTRGYEAADAEAMAALVNLIEAAAGGTAGFTPDWVASIVRGMVGDPATDTRLVLSPDGTPVAFGVVPTPPAGGFRLDLMGGVHPDWRGRGIGRELFGWELARAAEIHRAVAPDARWEVHAGALVTDEQAIRLYRRFGLEPVRYWFDMVAATVGAPVLETPHGLTVATYRSAYEKDLYGAHTEAFADHWGNQRRGFPEWSELTVRSEDFRPDLSALAFDGDEIAGYVLSYRDGDPARIYIGQVGVRRPWRRRGLAGALLSRVLRAAAADGRESAMLGVDADSPTGAVGVYARVGFVVDGRWVTYALPLPR